MFGKMIVLMLWKRADVWEDDCDLEEGACLGG